MSASLPQPFPEPSSDLVEFRFMLPANWRDELAGIARSRAISMADLLRLIVRDFMAHRRDVPS